MKSSSAIKGASPENENAMSGEGMPVSELVKILKESRLETDGASIQTAEKLTTDLLEGLYSRKFTAIHIPSFCAPDVAKRADAWIQENSKIRPWYLGKDNLARTDMSYGIGVPREQAEKSEEAAQEYIRGASGFMEKLRNAFAPDMSPTDKFILELGEAWTHGVGIKPFRGQPGYVGLVRIMTPEVLFNNIAGEMGVCHVDSMPKENQMSTNIYLNVPADGGELKLWNVKFTEGIEKNFLFRMILKRPFEEGVRDIVQHFLPEPQVIKPAPGDLIILDTSRPHAVSGFKTGHRTSVQFFIRWLDGLRSQIQLSS